MNVVPIGVFYLIFGRIAKQYRVKINLAQEQLRDVGEVQNQFILTARDSASRGLTMFWIFTVVALLGLFVIFTIYTKSIEPTADLLSDGLGIFGMGVWIPAVVGCTVITSFVVSRFAQVRALRQFIDELLASGAQGPSVQEARIHLGQNTGQLTAASLTIAAIASCVALGLGWLALFYLAAEQAITCARNSKGC